MTRYYLAGPMTGIKDLNFPAFHREAAHYRAQGHDVVNPAEVNADPTMSWNTCMRKDIPELCTCDGILMMPGWERSKGATLEHYIARQLDMQVVYLVREQVTA
jgi:hypothetical protein